MTIKKELDGKAEDFTEDYKEEKKPVKKDVDKERIDKLEKCIHNKDKRIKKIEDYFKLRNKLIITAVLSIVCGAPVAWMMYVFPKVLDNGDMLSGDENAIMLVGIITIIIVPIAIWLFSFSVIWEEG